MREKEGRLYFGLRAGSGLALIISEPVDPEGKERITQKWNKMSHTAPADRNQSRSSGLVAFWRK